MNNPSTPPPFQPPRSASALISTTVSTRYIGWSTASANESLGFHDPRRDSPDINLLSPRLDPVHILPDLDQDPVHVLPDQDLVAPYGVVNPHELTIRPSVDLPQGDGSLTLEKDSDEGGTEERDEGKAMDWSENQAKDKDRNKQTSFLEERRKLINSCEMPMGQLKVSGQEAPQLDYCGQVPLTRLHEEKLKEQDGKVQEPVLEGERESLVLEYTMRDKLGVLGWDRALELTKSEWFMNGGSYSGWGIELKKVEGLLEEYINLGKLEEQEW